MISRTVRLSEKPASSAKLRICCVSSGSCNSKGEILMEIVKVDGNSAAAEANALRMMIAVSSPIQPFFSASGINMSGAIMPMSG